MKHFLQGISLKITLILFFALVTILATGLVALLSFHNTRQTVGDVAQQLRTEVMGRIIEHVEEFLTYPMLINENNARAIGLEVGNMIDQETLVSRFSDQIDLFPMVTSIYFGNYSGGLANSGRDPLDDSRYVIVTDGFQSGTFRKIALDSVAEQGPELVVMPDFDATTRPWYIRARDEGGPVYSDIYIIFSGQDMALAASRPVLDSHGRFLGVVSVDLFLSHLSQFLKNLRIGRSGQAFIMERSGALVACSKLSALKVDEDPSLSSRVMGIESHDYVVRGAVRALNDKFGDLWSIDANQYLEFMVDDHKHLLHAASLKVSPGIDWLVMVSLPEADFMSGVSAQNRITLFLTINVLVLALIAGALMARGIIRPIKLLEGASIRMASGSRYEKIPGQSWFSEVRNLTTSFSLMSRKLFNSIHALNAELTERRHVEECLRESQARLQTITDSAQDAIIMMGPSGEISYWNPMAESIFGYTAEEAMGTSLHCLLAPPQYQEAFHTVFPEFQRTGQGKAVGKTIELTAMTRSGHEIPISLSLSAVSLRGSWHAVGIARDISQQKIADQKLIQAKEQAEAANIAKSQFLANMSHELRTPFNGIMGMMQLLQTTELNQEQQEYADAAIVSSRRFARLLSDILDLSSIQAGRMALSNTQFDVKELMESIAGLFSAQAREESINLQYLIDVEVPARLVGDVIRTKQILFNLVGNALKFCEQGSVHIRLSLLSAARGRDLRIMFSVSDTGKGIPEDKLMELFNPFVQVDCSYTREHQGAGLGLILVKELVELMDGNISVESEVGRGTTVHVVLPFDLPSDSQAESAIISAHPEHGKTKLDILLAEDDPLNQMFMIHILKKMGHTVTLAQNGQEAVEFFQNKDFDCILMDIQMPVMTGDEATRHIRAHEGRGQESEVRDQETGVRGQETEVEHSQGAPRVHGVSISASQPQLNTPEGTPVQPGKHFSINNPRIPIIAVTAHTQPGDREKFLNAGMDDYLPKPVNADDLKKKLENVQLIRYH